MPDLAVTDADIEAEIVKAERWINHHEAVRNRSLDLDLNLRLAIGLDAMRSHLRALKAQLCPDHQPSLFGDA